MRKLGLNTKWLLLFCTAALLGCSSSGQQGSWDLCEDKLNEFSQECSISTQPTSTNAILSIDEWLLDDTLVVCTTSNNLYCFYRLHADNFNLIDSLGKRGNGPDELVYPHMSLCSPGNYYVVDNGKKSSYILNKDSIVRMPDEKRSRLSALPRLMDYPFVGYVENYRSRKVWKKQNISTGVVIDSLCIGSIEDLDTVSTDFFWNWGDSGRRVILGFLNQNQFAVGVLDASVTMHWTLFTADTKVDKQYYSDVACGEKYFYLLSQQNVDMKKKSGYSMVEVYSYDGQPQMRVQLDIIARRMLIDEAKNRILFLSPLDDYIHVGTLNINA